MTITNMYCPNLDVTDVNISMVSTSLFIIIRERFIQTQHLKKPNLMYTF